MGKSLYLRQDEIQAKLKSRESTARIDSLKNSENEQINTDVDMANIGAKYYKELYQERTSNKEIHIELLSKFYKNRINTLMPILLKLFNHQSKQIELIQNTI
ncbi:hypothetical protein DICPUDRAFT_77994 [Dictyostelium purpureum]|uniref:Uncharacterized protein n=1 Tax=Dictyostelium purpureum TaxID=5786 RepID=F0ZI91_DICPU|nr:uncharacterized protein DICPUDRAFT_77994 [Dictyostelium purpureum]EGC36336.1 hypothetical protein DICPUDRAFT_77994 [Dictyostelium purpureum]|eukprot:XP_003287151.1 hypothetical protein DICPUDRAFT_77994 [Dictyostelium purpureum]